MIFINRDKVTDIKVGDRIVLTLFTHKGQIASVSSIEEKKIWLRLEDGHTGYLYKENWEKHTRPLTKLERALK